jgi:hypothetical protein
VRPYGEPQQVDQSVNLYVCSTFLAHIDQNHQYPELPIREQRPMISLALSDSQILVMKFATLHHTTRVMLLFESSAVILPSRAGSMRNKLPKSLRYLLLYYIVMLSFLPDSRGGLASEAQIFPCPAACD